MEVKSPKNGVVETISGVTAYDEDSAIESEYEEDRLEYEYDRVTRLTGSLYQCAFKKGISLRDVADKGASFEIDAQAGEGLPEEDTSGHFDTNLLKYARYDIVYDETSSTISEIDDSNQLTTPFDEIAKDAVDISPDLNRLVLKKVINPGSGITIPPNAMVRMHYNAYNEFSPEPFDSSRLRNSKQRLRLDGRTIPGLEIALSTMKKGEKSMFLIEPELAFGDLGVPPRIPPKATLLFDVELLEIYEGTAALEQMSPEEREEEVGFRKILKLGRGLLLYGNKHLKEGNLDFAADKYNRGIHLLNAMKFKDGCEEYEVQRLLIKFYNNMALVQDKKGNVKRMAYFSRCALRLDDASNKALFRLGRALLLLHDYDGARKFLMRAKSFCPRDPDILHELQNLTQRIQHSRQQEKAFARAAFGNVAPSQKVLPQIASKEFQEEGEYILKEFVASNRVECRVPGEVNDAELQFITDAAAALGLSVKKDSGGVLVVKSKEEISQ